MSRLPPDSFRLRATVHPARVTTGALREGQPQLTVSVTVDDEKVRSRADHFDGKERPFLLVPTTGAQSIDWKRVEFADGFRRPRSFLGAPSGVDAEGNRVDTYVDHISLRTLNTTPELLAEHGVAFGIDTNVGTLWGQEQGQNHAVDTAANPADTDDD